MIPRPKACSEKSPWAALAMLMTAMLGVSCTQADLFPYVSPDADDVFTEPATEYTLFGRPNSRTGLSVDCCMPTCVLEDGETWTAPLYLREHMQSLYSDWELLERWPVFHPDALNHLITERPKDGAFCAVLPRPDEREDPNDPMPYVLRTYPSELEAEAAGAMITHRGECGACSSLQNLAIYIANPDLTEPVRKCGISGLLDRDLSRLACIASLGFDLPCAQAWDFTTQRTASACVTVCGKNALSDANHNLQYECGEDEFEPNDAKLLNDCLACDELFSGDVFKVAAGRSRRRSGLPSAICRPCDAVYPVEHFYPTPDL